MPRRPVVVDTRGVCDGGQNGRRPQSRAARGRPLRIRVRGPRRLGGIRPIRTTAHDPHRKGRGLRSLSARHRGIVRGGGRQGGSELPPYSAPSRASSPRSRRRVQPLNGPPGGALVCTTPQMRAVTQANTLDTSGPGYDTLGRGLEHRTAAQTSAFGNDRAPNGIGPPRVCSAAATDRILSNPAPVEGVHNQVANGAMILRCLLERHLDERERDWSTLDEEVCSVTDAGRRPVG
jgi:hypothetical protein